MAELESRMTNGCRQASSISSIQLGFGVELYAMTEPPILFCWENVHILALSTLAFRVVLPLKATWLHLRDANTCLVGFG